MAKPRARAAERTQGGHIRTDTDATPPTPLLYGLAEALARFAARREREAEQKADS